MAETSGSERPPCRKSLSRREFTKTILTTAAASSLPGGPRAHDPAFRPEVQTPVTRLFRSLHGELRKSLCFPCDQRVRWQIQNPWGVERPRISDLSSQQRSDFREIFKTLCSVDGHGRFMKQMLEDYGGFERYHIAFFGEPETALPFEWLLTGRHVTIGVDGNGSGIRGSIFLGHSAEKNNVWARPGELADRLYENLDRDQKAKILEQRGNAKALPSSAGRDHPGLTLNELDPSLRAMAHGLVDELIGPFRSVNISKSDEPLRLLFYQASMSSNATWDAWKLEGLSFDCYYHRTPHVHTWLNLAGRSGVVRGM